MRLTLFYRKKYPTAFSIERLFGRLAEVYTARGVAVDSLELPWYNNALSNVWKNMQWARAQVQSKNGPSANQVNHITGDVNSIIFGIGQPTIITIHDCNPLLRYSPSHPRHWFYRWCIFEWPARRAAAVTVISEKTREEVLQLTNCPADKIHVIPNFVDPAFKHQPRPFNTDYPTILQIGTKENKNLTRLATALRGIPCRLQIIGKPRPEDMQALHANRIDFHWETGISDEAVRQHYVDCDLLAFVSTYEGFGLPILEAQMTGRCVVTSALSPHREVAGEQGALLVDPLDADAIRRGIISIIKDEKTRNTLLQKGHSNALNYHIDKIADRYLNLYGRIV